MRQSFQPDKILLTLLDHRVRFVVIGGIALAHHGYAGITQDIDICYARDAENLDRLCAALLQMHAKLRSVEEDVPFRLEPETLRAGANFTFTTDFGDFDILAVPDGVRGFEDIDKAAESVGIGVATVRIASLLDLERMKRKAGRPKDQEALRFLQTVRVKRERGEIS